jgi:hypothetical protein
MRIGYLIYGYMFADRCVGYSIECDVCLCCFGRDVRCGRLVIYSASSIKCLTPDAARLAPVRSAAKNANPSNIPSMTNL